MASPRIIEKIENNEYFEYKGNVRVTGSIGANATVVLKDGSLTVDGNVGDRSSIKMGKQSSSGVVISHGYFSSGSVVIGGSGVSLTIKGNVGNGVRLILTRLLLK